MPPIRLPAASDRSWFAGSMLAPRAGGIRIRLAWASAVGRRVLGLPGHPILMAVWSASHFPDS
jgi:hypothetical protein